MRRVIPACLVILVLVGGGTASGLEMPSGLSLSNQVEYSWSNRNEDPILEEWLDARYASGAFSGGIQLSAFQPPDPTESNDPSSFNVTHRYLEAYSDNGTVRAGHYYALFGQGMTLNAYEQRDIRVDTNLEGLHIRGDRGPLSVTLLSGTTVGGKMENETRPRTDRLQGGDVEFGWWQTGITLGASAVELQWRDRPTRDLRGGRMAIFRGTLDAQGEYAEIQRPGRNGKGLYLSANLGIGPLQLSGEYKDYDSFWLRASDGNTTYNLPPSVIRDHTYTLLNRHPHLLDADDETGFQVEGTLAMFENSTLTAYAAQTRNQEDERESNHFDEMFGELFLDLGSAVGFEDVDVVSMFDYQKAHVPGVSGDPFRTLWTSIAEFRLVYDDTHSFKVQTEYQHSELEVEGKFNTLFALLEWSRSPDITVNLVGETSDRSKVQRAAVGEDDLAVSALYGKISLHLSEHHDFSVLAGRRLAGFVCVGGICRFEPEFEGVEIKLFSRF